MMSYCWWKDLLWALGIMAFLIGTIGYGAVALSRVSCNRTAIAMGYDYHTFSIWTGCLVGEGNLIYKLGQRRDNHLHE